MKNNDSTQINEAVQASKAGETRQREAVDRFRRRMLEWDNPVEYVNNMYGCHPDDDENEYFEVIFAKD